MATAGAAAFALVLSGCGGEEDTTPDAEDPDAVVSPEHINVTTSDAEPQTGGELRYGLSAETDGWNPTLSRWAPSGVQVAHAIFDNITVTDSEGNWQPNLAEDLTPGDDFTSWTISLRDGVTFHDGSPLDAEALADFLTQVNDSPITGMAFIPVDRIEVDGDDVVVHMVERWTTFPYAMNSQIGAVAEPGWLAQGTPDNPVGTGPFRYVEWEMDEFLRVERNDDYWRDGLPYLDAIDFIPEPDSRTRTQGVLAGDLDLIQVTDPPEMERLIERAEAGDLQYLDTRGMETPEALVMLNLAEPPFDDPNARRALALATDREAFLENMGATDLLDPAESPYPPYSPWYTETDYPDFDPDAARELVEQVIEEHGSFSFTLKSTRTPFLTAATQALADDWEAVGMDVDLQNMDQPRTIRDVLVGDFEAVFWRQFDFPHPVNDSLWWDPQAIAGPDDVISLNFARNDDEEVRELLNAARQADPDFDTQHEHWAAVQQRINEVIPYIWLYHTRDAVVAQPNVVNITEWTTPGGETGLPFNQGTHPVAQIWIDPDL